MKETDKSKIKSKSSVESHAKAGGFFILTYIGAAWYFLEISSGFWGSILALLKAMIWPTYLIHRVFELLRI